MKSDLHKVLHPIAGRPMLEHLLGARRRAGARSGRSWSSAQGREQLEAALAARGVSRCRNRSSAPATRCSRPSGARRVRGRRADALRRRAARSRRDDARDGRAADAPTTRRRWSCSASSPGDPLQYGRVIAAATARCKMVEHKDARRGARLPSVQFGPAGGARSDDCSRCSPGSATTMPRASTTSPTSSASPRRRPTLRGGRRRSGRGRRDQHARRAGAAEARWQRAAAPRGDGRRRDAGRARDGVVRLGHRARPRHGDRAQRGLRPRRRRSPTGDDPRVQPSRGREPRRPARRSAPSRGCAPARCSAEAPRSAISSRSRTRCSARAPRPTI